MIHNIIPTPKKAEIAAGRICVPFEIFCEEPAWNGYVDTLSKAFEKLFGQPLSRSTGGILIKKDASVPPGGYRLDSRGELVLSAGDDEGILYAMATLLQAVRAENETLSIARAIIEDQPDKEYRALMVDLAREWHPADTILQYIDLCFIFKIKYLHLHFCDDQRYTLPSKAFPRLNTRQSYTAENIAAMRQKAAACGVILIPEFETPGHADVLNRNYPEVFANGYTSEPEDNAIKEGANKLICAGKPETMAGITTLLDEICELFPESPYIHIGGDEASILNWNHCPHCREYMAANGINDVHELYSEFVGRVAQLVLDRGKTPIVWEGFPKKGVSYIPKQTIVIAWESYYHMAYDLIAAGFKIINASWQPLYIIPSATLRWGIQEILGWDVYNWQHWWENSAAKLNPIHVAPTDQVLGAQLCVWEGNFEQEISRAIENLSALSERTWNVKRLWDDAQFIHRAQPTLHRVARLIQRV